MGPPWFGRYTVPLALLLVFLSGLGPALAWRRTTAANLSRELVLPAAAGIATLVVLLGCASVERRPAALAMFCLGAFVAAVVTQEFVRGVRARRAMTREPVPSAVVSLVRRNRRRYGGYIVHLGVTVLLVGVAASSTFQDASDVRLAPGESARVGGYELRVHTPHGRPRARRKRVAGEDRPRRRPAGDAGRRDATIHTERSYFPSTDAGPRNRVALLRGRGHERGRPAVEPAKRFLDGRRPEHEPPATTRSSAATACSRRRTNCPQPSARPLLGETLRRLVARYPADSPQATFRVIVSPLVTWIWAGALIVFLGGLVAIWPAPAGATRTVTAAEAARAARGLGRAWR